MDSERHKSDSPMSVPQRKYGLPSWMVSNMERLNHATDFEQYGSSPPETESFLTEAVEMRFGDAPTHYDQTEFHESKALSHQHSEDLVRTAIDHRRRLVLSMPRPEDCPVSSPDSTPCPTPEPSPVIRRKVSIPHPGDTVLTNPGRWFYFGKLKKPAPVSPGSNKENCDSVGVASGGGIKLVISNFDLNAVSPNSW